MIEWLALNNKSEQNSDLSLWGIIWCNIYFNIFIISIENIYYYYAKVELSERIHWNSERNISSSRLSLPLKGINMKWTIAWKYANIVLKF